MAATAAPATRPGLPVVLWQSVRPRSLTIAVMSSLVGTSALIPVHAASPVVAFLCLALAVLLQSATNVLNDAEDALTGADAYAGAGSSLAMRRAWIDAATARVISVCCFAAAALLGVGIVLLVHKPALLILGAGAALVGWAYTAAPLRLAYRPLGELASALPMGLGIPWGTAAAQAATVPSSVWWAAVPLALLTAAILHANNARDREHDRSVGKRTLATYLSMGAVVAEMRVLLVGVPLVIAAGVAVRALPLWSLIALLPAALALRAAARAHTSLDGRGWTMILLECVRTHLLTGAALCVAFALALLG